MQARPIQWCLNMRVLFFVFLFSFWLACQSGSNNSAPSPSGKSGDELAHQFCSGCHLFPEPALLSKQTWENGVLPEMAFRLGIRPLADKLSELSSDELETVVQSGNYPAKPALAADDWQKIVDYYVKNAPATPALQENKQLVQSGLPGFSAKIHDSKSGTSMVSMVKFGAQGSGFWVGARDQSSLDHYDRNFKKTTSFPVNSPVSDIAFGPDNQLFVLEMGNMEPNDSQKGMLIQMDRKGARKVLVRGLNRPVHLTLFDMNGDGADDFLICNYGNETGNLSWYDGKTQEEHLLKNQPGARKTIIADMDGDGRQDIVVLFCQGREQISIFYQEENHQFEEMVVQEFPPVYGSSCIEVADINADGKPDLAYTNGDNADYSFELKNYHGLRIFINDGAGQFPQQYFYPVHGAGMVKAVDSDHDGRLDLAVTSFFPDDRQTPNEGFLIFRQKQNLQFEIATFAEASSGRWLVMDTDRNGEILLGNFVKSGLGQKAATKNSPDFILLQSGKN